MDEKPSLKSKRQWLNALTLIAAVGLALAGTDLIKEHPAALSWIVAIVAVANVVLNLISTDKIVLWGLLLFCCLGASPAMAQGPGYQPQRYVPYRDVVIPEARWRKIETWEQRWSLLGGPYWVRRVQWQPLYPER